MPDASMPVPFANLYPFLQLLKELLFLPLSGFPLALDNLGLAQLSPFPLLVTVVGIGVTDHSQL